MTDGGGLLGDAADVADDAVDIDRARDRHVLPAGEFARRQLVDKASVKASPADGPPMPAVSILTSKGKSNLCALVLSATPETRPSRGVEDLNRASRVGAGAELEALLNRRPVPFLHHGRDHRVAGLVFDQQVDRVLGQRRGLAVEER